MIEDVTDFIGNVTGVVQNVTDYVFQNVTDNITGGFHNVTSNVTENVSIGVQNVTESVVKNVTESVTVGVQNVTESVIQNVTENVTTGVQTVTDSITSVLQNVTESFDKNDTLTTMTIDSSGFSFDSASFGYGVLAGIAIILILIGIKVGFQKLTRSEVAYSRIRQ
jgi:hypothetical protein